MRIQIEAAALGHAFQLTPSKGVLIFDVSGAAGVMRQLILGVLSLPQMVGIDAELHEPVEAKIDPVSIPFLGFGLFGAREVFHFHLLELARPEDEMLGSDLVAERLA